MKIALGADKVGKPLLDVIATHLAKRSGVTVADLSEPGFYADIAAKVSKAVLAGEYDRAVLFCGTGIGMSMAANKVKGIRAALCCDTFMAERARQHNDANVLCLGAERTSKAPEIVRAFLTTDFEGGRHQVRLDKMAQMEGG